MTHLDNFIDEFSLSKELDFSSIKVSIDSTYEANELTHQYFSSIVNTSEKEEFIKGAHLNILERIFNQVQGMMVCISSNCNSSAEVLCRTIIEGSVNLMYLTLKGDDVTLVAFFDSWVAGHITKLNQLKNNMIGNIHQKRVTYMIDERLNLIETYKTILDNTVETLGIKRQKQNSVWPNKIYRRFIELDKESDYYESYHRLSGSCHISAEDTISALICSNFNKEQKQKINDEAISYSIMMSRLTSLFFIDAAISCCMHHGLKNTDKFDNIKTALIQSVLEIS